MPRFTIQERVRWSDVDAANIIFYGAYIRFLEMAESEMFRQAGLTYARMYDELRVWLPRVHIECDFESAARLDDLLEVEVYVERLGTTSLHLAFEVFRGGRIRTARARFVLVTVDRDSFEKRPVPEEMRTALEAYRT